MAGIHNGEFHWKHRGTDADFDRDSEEHERICNGMRPYRYSEVEIRDSDSDESVVIPYVPTPVNFIGVKKRDHKLE